MEVKLFEVRESGCLYVVMAIRPLPRDDAEKWLLNRSGYWHPEQYIISGLIDPSEYPNRHDVLHFSYTEYAWTGGEHSRAIMQWIQRYLADHWDELGSGDVIDVDYIENRTKEPNVSDRLS